MGRTITADGVRYWCFVDHEPLQFNGEPKLFGGKAPRQWLSEKYCFSWTSSDLMRSGIYRYGGWAFDLRPFMKKYMYRDWDDRIQDAWAPNIKALRKAARISRYIKVVPVPEGF
jgi:hypothetical protein